MLSLWTEVVAVSEREALGQMARLDNRSGGTGRLLCNRMITRVLTPAGVRLAEQPPRLQATSVFTQHLLLDKLLILSKLTGIPENDSLRSFWYLSSYEDIATVCIMAGRSLLFAPYG